MTDWLKEIDIKKIVGAVLLDFSAAFDIKKIVGAVLLYFSAAFDIIDHNLFLRTCVLWLFNLCHIVDSELSI